MLHVTGLHLHEKCRGLHQSKVNSSLACIHGQVTEQIGYDHLISSTSGIIVSLKTPPIYTDLHYIFVIAFVELFTVMI